MLPSLHRWPTGNHSILMVSQSTAWERRGALSKVIAGLRAGGPALGAGGPGKRFVPKAEIEPVHSIASSAVASNDGEIAISSSFVVLRLMTVSNLVGCSTGISAASPGNHKREATIAI